MNSKTMGVVLISVISAISMGTQARTSRPDGSGFEAYRIIIQKNMFSPSRGIEQRKGQEVESARQEAEVAARSRIKVVGIIARDDPFSSIAIIEDNGRHRTCRIGDTVGPMMILDIGRQQIVFTSSGGTWVAEIEPGDPDRRTVGPQTDTTTAHEVGSQPMESGFSGRRVPIHRAQVPRLVRGAKFVADVKNGRIRGLRLTEDFMGLKEGDLVTFVGRQSLSTRYPRQKLWQMGRKYSSCREAMPEIQIVVERDNRELEFVLCPHS